MAALGRDSRRLFLSPVHAGKANRLVGDRAREHRVRRLSARRLDEDRRELARLHGVGPAGAAGDHHPDLDRRLGRFAKARWSRGFGFIGVATADALALSVLFGLLVIALSLPGGAIWLFSGERRVSEKIEALSATERTPSAE